MDEDRLAKLTDKDWVTGKLLEFCKAHGFDQATLSKKTRLTNLQRNFNDGTVPQWPNLIKILHACGSDLHEFIRFIDPGQPEQVEGIEIPTKHRPLFKMLSTIVSVDNPRRIVGITVNLEEFAARAKAEAETKSSENSASPSAEKDGNLAPRERKKPSKRRGA